MRVLLQLLSLGLLSSIAGPQSNSTDTVSKSAGSDSIPITYTPGPNETIAASTNLSRCVSRRSLPGIEEPQLSLVIAHDSANTPFRHRTTFLGLEFRVRFGSFSRRNAHEACLTHPFSAAYSS